MLRLLLLTLCALLLLPLHAALPAGTDLSELNSGGEQAYRERSFCAYLPLATLRDKYKIGNYSAYENPTGIYFRKGERVNIALADNAHGTVRFVIRDFREGGGEDDYAIDMGDNRFTVKRSGLGYIDYRSPLGCRARPLEVKIEGGLINGIFSHHDDNATWRRLLEKAPAGILDIMGERCQLVYHIEGLRQGNPDKGAEMLGLYDRIVAQQQQLMGWDSEGIHPGNHILCRVMWRGYMQADGLGAGFHSNTIAGISNPDQLRRGAWGVAHELGHVNQVRPDFCWGGMTEVSNNLFSSWTNYQFHPENMRLEHENTANADGRRMRGGRFDCYVNNAIVKRQLWQLQAGPDTGTDKIPREGSADYFVCLCPLWQLLLYCQVVRGDEGVFPALFHELRSNRNPRKRHGQMRVDFCRHLAEAAKCDLGDFYLQTGMLALMNRHLADYSSHQATISEGMIESALRRLARLPKPESSVIYYLTANSVDIYRDRLDVVKSPEFRPEIPEGGGDISFPADKWANAVAFEVYKGKKLLRICLRGLGQQDNASTTVICPPGANRIRAVQWDGKRYTVTEPEKKKGKKKRKKR